MRLLASMVDSNYLLVDTVRMGVTSLALIQPILFALTIGSFNCQEPTNLPAAVFNRLNPLESTLPEYGSSLPRSSRTTRAHAIVLVGIATV